MDSSIMNEDGTLKPRPVKNRRLKTTLLIGTESLIDKGFKNTKKFNNTSSKWMVGVIYYNTWNRVINIFKIWKLIREHKKENKGKVFIIEIDL